ncbi:MAG TPA: hypothetical protein VLE97_07150 [Gaiellaceae bacterium]|nr:hypothetical protein [Gaiellaceae bacterium]
MTDQPAAPPNPSAAPTSAISPDDLAGLLAASAVPSPEPPPSKSALRRKLLLAVLVAGVGLGASIMSCVGQSFSYRQAHALEGIEQQLKEIRASCPATAVERAK